MRKLTLVLLVILLVLGCFVVVQGDEAITYCDMKVDVRKGLNSDEIKVTVVVKNIGSYKGTVDAKLYVDGEAVCSKAIALEAEQKTMVTFLYKFAESGTHLVNVGDLEPLTLEIEGTLMLTPDEIENQGSYTTEWREPIMFTPSYPGEKMYWTWDTLTANTSIPRGAGLEAIIQVSDNGETIKDSKNVVLKDGNYRENLKGEIEGWHWRYFFKDSPLSSGVGRVIDRLRGLRR